MSIENTELKRRAEETRAKAIRKLAGTIPPPCPAVKNGYKAEIVASYCVEVSAQERVFLSQTGCHASQDNTVNTKACFWQGCPYSDCPLFHPKTSVKI